MTHNFSDSKRSLIARARSYEANAERLYSQIDQLDDDDPESPDAARDWSIQARHSDRMANECYRYAERV